MIIIFGFQKCRRYIVAHDFFISVLLETVSICSSEKPILPLPKDSDLVSGQS